MPCVEQQFLTWRRRSIQVEVVLKLDVLRGRLILERRRNELNFPSRLESHGCKAIRQAANYPEGPDLAIKCEDRAKDDRSGHLILPSLLGVLRLRPQKDSNFGCNFAGLIDLERPVPAAIYSG